MQLVIADTGPVNYLVLIGWIDILPALFETVIFPSTVRDELADPDTPRVVRGWVSDLPAWPKVHDMSTPGNSTAELGAGETAAIALAVELRADLLLMDDRRGLVAALRKGLAVTGTMGLLTRAAERGLLDLADAFDKLKQTNFRYRQQTMDVLLAKVKGKA